MEVEWDVLNFLTNGRFEYSIEGDTNKKVSGAASILSATERDLTFCSWEGEQALNAIKESNAGVIMCKKQLKGLVQPKKVLNSFSWRIPGFPSSVLSTECKEQFRRRKKIAVHVFLRQRLLTRA